MAPADEEENSQPASAVGRVGDPPADGIVEPGTSDTEPSGPGEVRASDDGDQTPAIAHVPIKKKGSRKR